MMQTIMYPLCTGLQTRIQTFMPPQNIHVCSQALCNTRSVGIYAKKSVQALLYCTWRELMVEMVTVKVSLGIIEMLTLLAWGMTTHNGSFLDRLFWTTERDPIDPAWLETNAGSADAYKTGDRWHHIYAYNSSCYAPCSWNILAALSLKATVNALWKCFAFWHRREMARQRFHESRSSFGYLRQVWRYWSHFGNALNQESAQMLVRCLLLFLTFGTPNSVMTSAQQATLSAAFFLSMLSILTNCRVVACKINLSRMAMRKALVDSEVTHFAFFVALAFFAFIAAWEVVDH